MKKRTILSAAAIAMGLTFGVGQGGSVELEPLEAPYCFKMGKTVYQVVGVRDEDGMKIVDVGSEMAPVVHEDEINSLCGEGFGE